MKFNHRGFFVETKLVILACNIDHNYSITEPSGSFFKKDKIIKKTKYLIQFIVKGYDKIIDVGCDSKEDRDELWETFTLKGLFPQVSDQPSSQSDLVEK